VLNKNFIRLSLEIQNMISEEKDKKELNKILNDAVEATIQIFDASFILGKQAEKVNVIKSFWGAIHNCINADYNRGKEENGSSKDKKSKKSDKKDG
jgi:hypothetical protein